MFGWRTSLWMMSLAALGPTLLWASPFGPARNAAVAVQLFFYGYPAWLLLTFLWLTPGLLLAKRVGFHLWWGSADLGSDD